jgi:regulator of replication initiation timing
VLSILTPDQQVEYAKARVKALTDNPALNAENDALKAQYAQVMAHGTAAQKQAMLEKADSHRLKLRRAMLKEDPNLGPIFTAIDKYISEQRAKGTISGN